MLLVVFFWRILTNIPPKVLTARGQAISAERGLEGYCWDTDFGGQSYGPSI